MAAARQRRAAATFAGSPLLLGQEEIDGLGKEPVAREDRNVLAELLVRCGTPAPHIVVVHRGQVVVNERVRVHQLDGRRRGENGLGLGTRGLCGRQAEHRTHSLAACQERVPHRLRKARGLGPFAEPKPPEILIHELPQPIRIRTHKPKAYGV